jgi:hypothetical protein
MVKDCILGSLSFKRLSRSSIPEAAPRPQAMVADGCCSFMTDENTAALKGLLLVLFQQLHDRYNSCSSQMVTKGWFD